MIRGAMRKSGDGGVSESKVARCKYVRKVAVVVNA